MSSAGLIRSLPQIVLRAVQSRMADMHTALPGKVVRYDATKNQADVEIMVKHPVFDADGRALEPEDLGILVGVPVKMPRAGGFLISIPLAAGDEGELVFHSTAIGEWRSSGQKSEPADTSRHSIGWPTFRPDLFNDANPIASSDLSNREAGIVIGKEGSDEQILIQSGVILLGKSATDYVALASKVLTQLQNMATAFNNHTHLYLPGTGASTATGTPGASTPPESMSPATVAAALVKAK